MTTLRPFVPPQAPVPVAESSPAPSFPAMAGTAPRPGSPRSFVPPPLVDETPQVDLQAMLDAAQREVDALQARTASQSQAFEQEKSKFHDAFSVIEACRVKACRVLAKDAVMLGVEIAHALAGKAFEVDQTHLLALLEKCLQEFSREHPVQVRVCPADAPHVRAHLEAENATSIEVHPDPALSPGDLTVEAEQLVIDATLAERVETLREELAATVRADEALEPEPEPEPEPEDGAAP